MNIAMIHSNLDGRGGSQRYVLEQARAFRRLGHEVEIFSCYHSPSRCYPELLEGKDIRFLHNLDREKSRPASFRTIPVRMAKALAKGLIARTKIFGTDYLVWSFSLATDSSDLSELLERVQTESERRFDIIFAHEGPLSAWSAAKFKKRHGTPVYWFCYDTLDKWYLDWLAQKGPGARIRRFFLNLYWARDRSYVKENMDRAAVLDSGIAERFFSFYGYRPGVVRGGINQANLHKEKSDYLRGKYGLNPDTIILSCVTRFRRYRRVHDFLELGRRLRTRSNLVLYLNSPVNEKDYYDELMSSYREYLFPKGNIIVDVEFAASDEHMFEIYRSSAIFVFPNENQTWGNAPLEAMASSTLAMVSEGCGISEIIRPITDTVFPVGDLKSLEMMVLRYTADPELMEDAANKQFEYVRQNLTWEKICQHYIREFEDIIHGKGN